MFFMRSVSTVRHLDQLGRIVIPIEVFRLLGINADEDSLEIFIETDTNEIAMKRYTGMSCTFCYTCDGIKVFKNKLVCCSCWDEISILSDPKTDTFVDESLNKLEAELQTAVTSETVDLNETVVGNRKRKNVSEALAIIEQILESNPRIKQKEIAGLLNISQGRISQLMSLLVDKNK
jgi:transcriptional pleiotropic regulator of transition state genes